MNVYDPGARPVPIRQGELRIPPNGPPRTIAPSRAATEAVAKRIGTPAERAATAAQAANREIGRGLLTRSRDTISVGTRSLAARDGLGALYELCCRVG